MKNILFILLVLLLLVGYGIKFYKHLEMQRIEDANFNTAVQCVQDLQNGKTGVCD